MRRSGVDFTRASMIVKPLDNGQIVAQVDLSRGNKGNSEKRAEIVVSSIQKKFFSQS